MANNNKGQLLQDPFLNALRKEHIPVNIYLINGIKLQGHGGIFRPVRRAASQHRDADGLQARDQHGRADPLRHYHEHSGVLI